MSSIDIRNLSFCYRSTAGSTMALQDLSLSIPQGQFVCLVGHSAVAGFTADPAGEGRQPRVRKNLMNESSLSDREELA